MCMSADGETRIDLLREMAIEQIIKKITSDHEHRGWSVPAADELRTIAEAKFDEHFE